MKLGRINHIGLITESMDRSLAFYRDVMGAEVIHPPFEMGGPDGASICVIVWSLSWFVGWASPVSQRPK